jgi:hypothetical protein
VLCSLCFSIVFLSLCQVAIHRVRVEFTPDFLSCRVLYCLVWLKNVGKEFAKNHKRVVGEANFQAAKEKAGRLSALEMTDAGKKWLQALVPKDEEKGAELASKLTDILKNRDLFDRKK